MSSKNMYIETNISLIFFIYYFIMIEERIEQYEEVSRTEYNEITEIQEEIFLYIFKEESNGIEVRIPDSKKNLSGWAIKSVECVEQFTKKGDEKCRVKMKIIHRVKFPGELIMTSLPEFNAALKEEIIDQVENANEQLRRWLEKPIKDIFMVVEKMGGKFGFRHGFVKVMSLRNQERKSFYLERRVWKGNENSRLRDIEEGIRSTFQNCISSYSQILSIIYSKLKKSKSPLQI